MEQTILVQNTPGILMEHINITYKGETYYDYDATLIWYTQPINGIAQMTNISLKNQNPLTTRLKLVFYAVFNLFTFFHVFLGDGIKHLFSYQRLKIRSMISSKEQKMAKIYTHYLSL